MRLPTNTAMKHRAILYREIAQLEWADYPETEPTDADSCRMALALVDSPYCVKGTPFAERTSLALVRWSAGWMEHDDLGWHGPVRYVVAYAWIVPQLDLGK